MSIRTVYIACSIQPWHLCSADTGRGLKPLTGPGLGVAIAFETLEELQEVFGEDSPYMSLEATFPDDEVEP